MSKTILFFGNERLATGVTTNTPVLKALVLNGYKIVGIVVTPIKTRPSRKARTLEVSDFATKHKIPLLELTNLKTNLEELRNFPADIGVLVAYGQIIPKEVISLFPKGIVNLHPSLLPKHRGPTPIESTILQGETQTGISLMSLTEKMDAGPIYDQASIAITPDDSKQTLADKLGSLGASRLTKLLPDILSSQLKPVEQKPLGISYDKKLTQEMSLLDFTKPARVLESEIRAFYNWPRSKTSLNNIPAIITKAHVAKQSITQPGRLVKKDNCLAIETSKDLLVIDQLIVAGSKEMPSSDYLRGHPLLN